ncbi:hypothetical protein G6F62_010478 [Rhizopus arrhizus]|nr:hypothetical protein G6F62_010478 [Rhizopus arrhizus]
MREIFGQATKNIDNYRTKISAQTKEISELKDQLKEYQTREEQYKIDLDANQIIIEKLSNEKESVEKTIDGLKEKNEDLMNEVEQVKKEYEQYKKRAHKLLEKTKGEHQDSTKVKELESKVQELEEKCAAECAKKSEHQFVLERDLRKAIDHINELEANQASLIKEKNTSEIKLNKLYQASLREKSRLESLERSHQQQLINATKESQGNLDRFQTRIKQLEDENQILQSSIHDLNQKIIKESSTSPSEEQEKLEKQIDELRILLRECQGDNKLLRHQERLLKSELRKLNEVDKKQNMNTEYLKNVLLKFLISENKQTMVPIISKLLSLDEAETISLRESCNL